MTIDVKLPTARDCMSVNVLTFSPEEDLFDAIETLLRNSFAAAPVVDGDGSLLGMLTEKDCLRVLSNLAYDNLEGGKVKDYLSPIRVVVAPEMDLFRATEVFLGTNFPLLPVVEDGKLCGVISRRDMLRGVRAFRAELDRKQHELEKVAGHQADRPRSIGDMQKIAASQSREQMVRLFARRT